MSEQNETTALVPTTETQAFNREQLDLIKRTVANGTDDTEFALFIEVAKRTGLDPFSKQIYAVMRWDNEAKRKRMTIQTGIDGYFAIADRTGEMAGVDDLIFDTEDAGHPNRATATVWRWKNGQRVPYTYTARWSEYVQLNKDKQPTSMWERMPYTMLGKCAQARALRMAFPAQIGGVYTHEEMTQADSEPTTRTTATTDRATRQPAAPRVVESDPARDDSTQAASPAPQVPTGDTNRTANASELSAFKKGLEAAGVRVHELVSWCDTNLPSRHRFNQLTVGELADLTEKLRTEPQTFMTPANEAEEARPA